MKQENKQAKAAGQEKPAFNQIAYQNEYNKQKYDRHNLIMPKGTKERIKAAAAERQSVNGFINAAIEKALNSGTGTTE